MDDSANEAGNCFPADGSFSTVSEDFVAIATYVDFNDVEGFHFINAAGETNIYKANFEEFFPNPPDPLNGRAIGFRIQFGHTN